MNLGLTLDQEAKIKNLDVKGFTYKPRPVDIASDIKLASDVLDRKDAAQRYGYSHSQIGQAKANLVRAKRAGKKLEKKLQGKLRKLQANQES